MSDEDPLQRQVVVELMRLVLGDAELQANQSLSARGLDSLQWLELKAALEDRCEVLLRFSELACCDTAADVARVVAAAPPASRSADPVLAAGARLPATRAQRELWFAAMSHPSPTAYNVPILVRLTTRVDAHEIFAALCALGERHEALRSAYTTDGDELFLSVRASAPPSFHVDTRRYEDPRVAYDRFAQPHDLERGPLWRACLFDDGRSSCQHLLLDFHHVVVDGVAVQVLLGDLATILGGDSLPAPGLLSGALAAHEDFLASPVAEAAERYWLDLAQTAWPNAQLPGSRASAGRSAEALHAGGSMEVDIAPELAQQVRSAAAAAQVSLSEFLLSAVHVLLAKLSGEREVSVGVPTAGRPSGRAYRTVGAFVQTLPTRHVVEPAASFHDLLTDVRHHQHARSDHQEFPFASLELGITPDVVFSMEAFYGAANSGESPMVWEPYRYPEVRYGLLFYALDQLPEPYAANALRFVVEYDLAVHSADAVSIYADCLITILEQVAANPTITMSDIALLDGQAAQQQAAAANPRVPEFLPPDRSIVDRFDRIAASFPDRDALSSATSRLTYGALKAQSIEVASQLSSLGVRGGDRVALIADRSVEFVVLVLAILRCSASYVPLDSESPIDRLSQSASRAACVLAVSTRGEVELPAVRTVSWDALRAAERGEIPAEKPSADAEAYVMFTSGSTGQPKGVCVSHRNVLRLVETTNVVPLSGHTRVVLTGSPSFDATTYEIWAPLLNGGHVALVDKETILDAELLEGAIATHDANVMWLTAPLFEGLVAQRPAMFSQLSHLIVGGDVVPPAAVAEVYRQSPSLVLVNGYGPTENTTFSTFYPIPRTVEGPIPVGSPLARSTGYVMDAAGNLQPPFALGELCVGGEGVALGYCGDTSATEEKFVVVGWPDGRQERLYRTGDLAWWGSDGLVNLAGRADDQVKIRGFRIEPGEIQNVLLGCDGIEAAYVGTTERDDKRELVAYVVPGADLDRSKTVAHLNENLPRYMVPTWWAEIDAMPLNVNGKVDRAQLPTELITWRSAESPRPTNLDWTSDETAIAEVWRDLLDVDVRSIDQHFYDLGGDSLKVQQLSARLEARTGKRPSLARLMKAMTVRDQALVLRDLDSRPVQPELQRGASTRFAPNEAQVRLHAIEESARDGSAYLVPNLFEVAGTFEPERWQQAWKRVCEHHEFLRSSFAMTGGQLEIIIEPTQVRPLMVVPRDSGTARSVSLDRLLTPAALGAGDVVRAALIEGDDDTHLLALVFHHIAFDGVAIEVVLHDLAAAFRGDALQPVGAGAAELWASLACPETEQVATSYWVDRLSESSGRLQLPHDFSRNPETTNAGDVVTTVLPATLSADVNAYARREGISSFTFYLTALYVLLHKYSRQPRLEIGVVSSGRHRPATERAVGMLAKTLPLSVELGPPEAAVGGQQARLAVPDLLQRVHDELIAGLEHQDFSLSDVANALSATGTGRGRDLFDVMFTMFGRPSLPGLGGTASWTRAPWRYPKSKFDLNFMLIEENDSVEVSLEYATDLFARATCERMLGHYVRAIEQMLSVDDVDELMLHAIGEHHEIVDGFNETARDYDRAGLMHEQFERLAHRQPDHCAVSSGTTSLSYSELDRRANQLAHLLADQGVGPGVPVAVVMDRSPAVIVAVLAVLKAGGHYVPIEPDIPTYRVRTIVDRLALAHLITDEVSLSAATDDEPLSWEHVVCLEGRLPTIGRVTAGQWYDAASVDAQPTERLDVEFDASTTAYIIHTSGSTGEPKGVEVCHRPAINLIEWVNRTYDIGPDDTVLFVTSLSFDLSVYDIFGLLSAGGTIRIASRDDLVNPARLVEIMRFENITFWDSAPAAFQQVLHGVAAEEVAEQVRLIFLSGDWVSVALPQQARSRFPNAKLVVLGGATEATVWSNYFDVDQDTSDWVSIPYGKPIQNARYYVLDDSGRPQPIGVPGRLFIGGECLALGYAEQPDLTASRFVPDTFQPEPSRMYDTGDLARWRPDGNLQFLGREDHQVKINGHRIELGEIEQCLLQHPLVEDALAVVAKTATGADALVAHVVGRDTLTAEDVQDFAATRLPPYMVPKWASVLDVFPTTPNGKLDRGALPTIESMAVDVKEAAVVDDPVEGEIQSIWTEVLGIADISVDVPFQSAGGGSVELVRVHSLIDEKWPGVLEVPDLFGLPSIRSQAQRLRALGESAAVRS